MDKNPDPGRGFLTLDNLRADPLLARRLPAELAQRYHALLIAQDGQQATVAMADPDNEGGRVAVTRALSEYSSVSVVRGDPAGIDGLLAELWPTPLARCFRLVLFGPGPPGQDEIGDWARLLANMLDASTDSWLGTASALVETLDADIDNLILLRKPGYGRVWSWLRQQCRVKTASVLITGAARWPLRKLLVLIRSDVGDDAAMQWAVRLARPASAQVSLLAVVPPMPAMYSGLPAMHHNLDALLATDTAMGRRLRGSARWLAEWGVEGTLRLRQGRPDWEVCCEVMEGDHDLVILGTDPDRGLQDKVMGHLAGPLARLIERPLLIARPIIAL